MMTKKTLAAATLVELSITGASAQAQNIDNTSFSYVGSWSSLSLYQNFERPFWEKHIPEASGGQISTQITTFDQMGLGGGEVYRLMARNVIEVTSTVAGYAVADAPELEGLDLPMLIVLLWQTSLQNVLTVPSFWPLCLILRKWCFSTRTSTA
jgi:TRAP-type C4-dicarboxylate transport system substrate-binding protein